MNPFGKRSTNSSRRRDGSDWKLDDDDVIAVMVRYRVPEDKARRMLAMSRGFMFGGKVVEGDGGEVREFEGTHLLVKGKRHGMGMG